MTSIAEKIEHVISFVPDSRRAAEKIAEIACCSAAIRAQDMADEAAVGLMAMGIDPASMSRYKAMAFSARQQLEKLCMMGILRRSHFKTPHGKQVKATIGSGACTSLTPEELRDLAFFLDVCLFIELHFSPLRGMLRAVLDKGTLGDNPEGTYLTAKPFSEEARTSIESIAKTDVTKIKSRPVAAEPVTIDELLRELRLTEVEAARIWRKSAKTLADHRRAGRIPDSAYVQDSVDGTVYYLAEKWRAFVTGALSKK